MVSPRRPWVAPLDDPNTTSEISRETFEGYALRKYGDRFLEARSGDSGDGANLALVLTPVEPEAFNLLHDQSQRP